MAQGEQLHEFAGQVLVGGFGAVGIGVAIAPRSAASAVSTLLGQFCPTTASTSGPVTPNPVLRRTRAPRSISGTARP
ncbi:hypothetical protein ACX9NE_07815 [Mycobacterium sp. ML4]